MKVRRWSSSTYRRDCCLKSLKREKTVANIVKLISFSKIFGIPIILTEQYPKGLGKTVKEIKDDIPDVVPIEKTSFSCLGAQEFKDALVKMKISTLILTGIEAHVCVVQTALDALGDYRVYVISDAVLGFVCPSFRAPYIGEMMACISGFAPPRA